jgi:hypothetical protein
MSLNRKAMAFAVSALLGAAAIPSSAATFINNVQSIVVTNDANTWLQIGEIQAFDALGANVALGATATSNIATAAPYGTSPMLANDGNTNTFYWTSPGIYHSTVQTGEALKLTFSSAQNLSSFKIFGRDPSEGANCCNDRNQFNVVFNQVDGSFQSYKLDARGSGAVAQITSPVPEPGELAMMIAGLGVVAVVVRKKNKPM